MKDIIESLQLAVIATAYTLYQLAKPTAIILAIAFALSLVIA